MTIDRFHTLSDPEFLCLIEARAGEHPLLAEALSRIKSYDNAREEYERYIDLALEGPESSVYAHAVAVISEIIERESDSEIALREIRIVVDDAMS